jgi:predicted ester cyclase
VRHNGRPFGLAGYRALLERDFAEIPDLRFHIELIVCEPPHVASPLRFDCRPRGLFIDLPMKGRRVIFAENVFYQFRSGRIGGLVGDRQGGDRSSALMQFEVRRARSQRRSNSRSMSVGLSAQLMAARQGRRMDGCHRWFYCSVAANALLALDDFFSANQRRAVRRE